MQSQKSVDWTALGLMVPICLVWAFQQIGLKATESLAAPVFQIGIRSGIAAVAVFFFILFKGEGIPLFGRQGFFGGLAGALFALEFLLIGEALRHTSAAHVVVFLYTAPVFSALGLHWKLREERLSVAQWCGIGLAAAGIAFAFLVPSSGKERSADWESTLWGDSLALMAGAAWGLTTVVIRTTQLSILPAKHVLFYQLFSAFIILTGFAAYTQQTAFTISTLLFANLLFQTVIVSIASFLAWFWLLKKYRASQLGVFSFMTPLFGVLLGVILLDEKLSQGFVVGSVAVIAGIVLVSASRSSTEALVSSTHTEVRRQSSNKSS
ncbi:DMT family transporter [Asticcacaulis sp. W401b]|uniref:DMT family transporter n=1 Tax=Asticcacaulis sp. W401b TaxID=3388666 RepID=UPI003970578C